MRAQLLTVFQALLTVEVLCLLPLVARKAGIGQKQVSEFKSGYLTMIPVGAILNKLQQDIKVNWQSDGSRTPDRDRPRPEP
ncbi:hypothetical protein [Microcoleus sp. F4-D5]|uniref:hypothetical protein n=1 Tax=Microcoleus sp. F4-D5 TaxID=2818760 RepID=UPI002FD69867